MNHKAISQVTCPRSITMSMQDETQEGGDHLRQNKLRSKCSGMQH